MNLDLSKIDAEKMAAELGPLVTAYLLRAVGALILFVIAWMIAGWVSGLVLRVVEKRGIDLTLGKFGSNVVRWMILVAAGVAILGMFGIETASFAAVLGAAGLAIGLALQGSLSNVGAGAVLLIFRPFKVGDFITAAGHSGTVNEITLLATNLDTGDNRRIIIPNSKILGDSVVNASFHDIRRVDVDVGTDYGADIVKTREVLEKICASIDGQVAGKDYAVVLGGLGASSIDWSLRIWVPSADFWAKKGELTQAIKVQLDEAGIGIPFPQMDVHVDKLDAA